MKKNWNREFKNAARDIALQVNKKKTSLLLLPGFQAQCLKDIVEKSKSGKGILDLKGDYHIYLVERNLATIGEICRLLEEYPLKLLDRKRITIHHGELHDLEINRPIDFAFLDFTAPLTAEVAEWLRSDFQNYIAPDLDLAFTFAYAVRGHRGLLMPQLRDYFRSTERARQFNFTASKETGLLDYKASVYISALKLCLNRYDFLLREAFRYCDTNPMLLLVLGDFKKRRKEVDGVLRTDFDQLIYSVLNRSLKMATPKKLSPAQRAAATRQARLAARKRSNAAFRANASRTPAERSAIARKAAQTRRENALMAR